MPKQPATVSETLRQAIVDSGLTHYRISKDIGGGVSIDTITRFVVGVAGLGSEKLDALCEYFELNLVPKQAGKSAKTKPTKRRKKPQNKG